MGALEKYSAIEFSSNSEHEAKDQQTAKFFSEFDRLSALAPDKKKMITELRETLMHAQVVRLTFALAPDTELVVRASNQVRLKKGNENALIEISIEPSQIAGLIVSDDGKLQDFSLQKKIESMDLGDLLHKHVPSLGP